MVAAVKSFEAMNFESSQARLRYAADATERLLLDHCLHASLEPTVREVSCSYSK
jgi:hypothetical protein